MGGDSASNWLYYGDNLDILRERITTGSVDLVYLDPPFNSNRAYNVIFDRDVSGARDEDATAQIQAFDDTWHWTPATEQQYQRFVNGALPEPVTDALLAFRTLLGENDALAYLVNMAPRLVELHRVLKRTGSLYLHCDPTMSHYLKLLLDSIFGAERFRSEIIWKRHGSHNDAKGWGAVHDVILYYAKTGQSIFNKQYTAYDETYIEQRFRFRDADGRRWMEQNLSSPNPRPNLTYPYAASNGVTYQPPRNGWKVTPERMAELDALGRLHFPIKGARLRLKNYLDEGLGLPAQDIWTDIPVIGGTSLERLGYQTQKPVALLERIISASSNPGDTVLDPFCGCGTTIDAAQRLGRPWIGIDVAFIAIDLIMHRLRGGFPGIDGSYKTHGIPRDIGGARDLFHQSPFDYERWAVSLIGARPNEKQRGDKGVDGVARFYLARNLRGRILASVKGGDHVGPQFVRDLLGTVATQKAEMGVLILLSEPTRGILDAVDHGGTYRWPITGQTYPKIQVITIKELLAGKKPNMPTTLEPYPQAFRVAADSGQMAFADLAEETG